jgi:hypothetical protein
VAILRGEADGNQCDDHRIQQQAGCFLAADEEGRVFFLDFSDVETWYKKAVVRREAEEKKFAQEFERAKQAEGSELHHQEDTSFGRPDWHYHPDPRVADD